MELRSLSLVFGDYSKMTEFADVKGLLERLQTHAAASPDDLACLPGLASRPWPKDYLDCLRWSNGLEGYVGGRGYLRLWPAGDVRRLNAEYGVEELLPGLVLTGSDAAALGYGFDLLSPDPLVVSIEMAAMHREYLTTVAASFCEFLQALAAEPLPAGESEPASHTPPEWLRGKIIHEKHPIVLGGSPDDPENRILVPEQEHPRLTLHFARILHSVRAQSLGEEPRRRTRG
jgi:hypothetical protein